MRETSRLRDVQFRLEYGLLRLVVGFIRLMPLSSATAFSAWSWGWLAPRINPRRHKRALDNLNIAFPEKTQAERDAIALAHWKNLGRVMAETMQIDRVLAQPDAVEMLNPKVFGRYSGKLGPIIGVSMHMGNWELAILPFVWANANPAAVYRSVNNPYVDRFLRHQRKDLYPGGLFGRGTVEGDHGDDKKTARLLTDFVRNGGRLGIVSDLYDRRGMAVPFFGKDAKTLPIAGMIARRLGTRIWMSRCMRVGTSSRFQIELKELRVPRTANTSDDVRTIITDMQKQFEDWVRDCPEQWMWSNRRWS